MGAAGWPGAARAPPRPGQGKQSPEVRAGRGALHTPTLRHRVPSLSACEAQG